MCTMFSRNNYPSRVTCYRPVFEDQTGELLKAECVNNVPWRIAKINFALRRDAIYWIS